MGIKINEIENLVFHSVLQEVDFVAPGICGSHIDTSKIEM